MRERVCVCEPPGSDTRHTALPDDSRGLGAMVQAGLMTLFILLG